jgi:hypothetical protein
LGQHPGVTARSHRRRRAPKEVSWSSAQSIQGDVPQSFSMDFDAGQRDSFSATVDCDTPAP